MPDPGRVPVRLAARVGASSRLGTVKYHVRELKISGEVEE